MSFVGDDNFSKRMSILTENHKKSLTPPRLPKHDQEARCEEEIDDEIFYNKDKLLRLMNQRFEDTYKKCETIWEKSSYPSEELRKLNELLFNEHKNFCDKLLKNEEEIYSQFKIYINDNIEKLKVLSENLNKKINFKFINSLTPYNKIEEITKYLKNLTKDYELKEKFFSNLCTKLNTLNQRLYSTSFNFNNYLINLKLFSNIKLKKLLRIYFNYLILLKNKKIENIYLIYNSYKRIKEMNLNSNFFDFFYIILNNKLYDNIYQSSLYNNKNNINLHENYKKFYYHFKKSNDELEISYLLNKKNDEIYSLINEFNNKIYEAESAEASHSLSNDDSCQLTENNNDHILNFQDTLIEKSQINKDNIKILEKTSSFIDENSTFYNISEEEYLYYYNNIMSYTDFVQNFKNPLLDSDSNDANDISYFFDSLIQYFNSYEYFNEILKQFEELDNEIHDEYEENDEYYEQNFILLEKLFKYLENYEQYLSIDDNYFTFDLKSNKKFSNFLKNLSYEREKRRKFITKIGGMIAKHWKNLGVDSAERDNFMKNPILLSKELINHSLQELDSLYERKDKKFPAIIKNVRDKILEIWQETGFDTKEERLNEFSLFYKDISEFTDIDDALEAHNVYYNTIFDLSNARCPIISKIYKREELIKDRSELYILEIFFPDRLFTKNKKLKIIRKIEDYKRNRIKNLKTLTSSIQSAIKVYEITFKKKFIFHGDNYLERIEKQEIESQKLIQHYKELRNHFKLNENNSYPENAPLYIRDKEAYLDSVIEAHNDLLENFNTFGTMSITDGKRKNNGNTLLSPTSHPKTKSTVQPLQSNGLNSPFPATPTLNGTFCNTAATNTATPSFNNQSTLLSPVNNSSLFSPPLSNTKKNVIPNKISNLQIVNDENIINKKTPTLKRIGGRL